MTRTNLKLAEAPSVERTTLAEAIERSTDAERIAIAAREAVTRASEMVKAATAQLDDATADVATARERQATNMAAAAKSGAASSPDKSMREARAQEIDASDELDAARAALAACEAALIEPEKTHTNAQQYVESCADAVMATGVAALLVEAEAIQRELGVKRAVLQFLRKDCIEPYCPASEIINWDEVNAGGVPRSKKNEAPAVSKFLDAPVFSFYDTTHPAIEPWRAARDALMRDASAPLPGAVQ